MSETVARQRPFSDLDDFERRLDSRPQRHSQDDDPLAELARLVGEQHDPYGDVFAREASAAPHADFRPSFEPHARQEPAFGREPPRFAADFAAIEAGLRGAVPGAPQQAAQVYAAAPPYGYAQNDYPEPQFGVAQNDMGYAAPDRMPATHGVRRPVYAMAATIVIAVVGIGVAFAYKGSSSSPREIKTIMAAAGPTKIQPPADATADPADQESGALAQQAAPTKLVSHEEQPVDLAQTVQDNASRDPASQGTDAASVPVPLSPAQAANTMSPDYSAAAGTTADAANPGSTSTASGDQGFGIGMPAPKKVKVVSVRPDGTIVSGDGSDAAAGSSAANPTPSPSSMKSTSRVATAAPPASDDSSVVTPSAPAPKPTKTARKAKPVHVATAETGTPAATEEAETKSAGAGAFAVQLAAPGSEAEAKSATSRLVKKYGSALSGRRLGFHRAESNGHTVFRIRVSSLTKEDAVGLCTKLKATGGTCFVAKN